MTHPLINKKELEIQPIERAETIPSGWYTNPEIFEFEKDVIFSNYWQLVCHESRLANPGDVFTLEVADNPIIVLRDKACQLRAFYNVCRHRGGPLAVKKGTTSVLQCQYHGWTYLLDGSLRGIPQWDRVDLFDKKEFGLLPVELQTRDGLIFINLSKQPEDINTFLEGINDRISPIILSDFKFHSEQRYTIDCNWKVYVDNFLEGYHVPIVHPELAKLLDYRRYVTETSDWHSLQYSPFKGHTGDNLYGAKDGEAYYYFIFPNIMLNILPGRLQTNTVKPISPCTCEVIFSYYYLGLENEKAQKIIRDDIFYSDKIQQEDIEICKAVQKGLKSKGYNKGRFSVEREEGVYHFQCLLKNVYKQAVSN